MVRLLYLVGKIEPGSSFKILDRELFIQVLMFVSLLGGEELSVDFMLSYLSVARLLLTELVM